MFSGIATHVLASAASVCAVTLGAVAARSSYEIEKLSIYEKLKSELENEKLELENEKLKSELENEKLRSEDKKLKMEIEIQQKGLEIQQKQLNIVRAGLFFEVAKFLFLGH